MVNNTQLPDSSCKRKGGALPPLDRSVSGNKMPFSILSEKNIFHIILTFVCLLISAVSLNAQPAPFASSPLKEEGDLSSLMVEGISRYFDRENTALIKKRDDHWDVDFSSHSRYQQSVMPNRQRFAQIIGAVDERLPDIRMEYIATTSTPARIGENDNFEIYAVRWQVFEGVYGEGLLLQPKGDIKAKIVAIPDADQTPESLVGLEKGLKHDRQYARRLAENGCQVIIPTIIDRSATRSGSERLNRYTNQPHREWIYRQSYTFGRHIIGYEVQKILGAVDWFSKGNEVKPAPIGVAGWGEGGLLSLYSAALDKRIDAALVSGYFTKRENLWQEPIYRNLFGLLREFGDAEITRLVIPRAVIIEHSPSPDVSGPPPARPGPARLGASAAPGKITTPAFNDVDSEISKSLKLAGEYKSSIHFVHNHGKITEKISDRSLLTFLQQLRPEILHLRLEEGTAPSDKRVNFDPSERQHRQVLELENFTQKLIAASRHVRDEFFWNKIQLTTPEAWRQDKKNYQGKLWDNIIGRIPPGKIPLNPRSRQIFDKPEWTGYEVTLDVLPDVFAWGYLLLPKDIKPGQKRPVIVVQHGGSGVPAVVMDKQSVYKGLAVQLVERGFIVFAPHFPWRAGHQYRNLQRKANPMGLTIFSIILNQHQRMLDWLIDQPWVDPARIGLYGLSWGGKVAVRVPALLEQYSLSICSGDFNEWVWKNATTDWPNSYMFVPEYEMFDFNLAMTFNYGEMAALIAPRAFMVERGHDDGVGIDEWVAFEYAKVNRLYDKLQIPHMTRIEYFNGGHEINAVETFDFIHHHFDWPLP